MDRIKSNKTAHLASECNKRFALGDNVKRAIEKTDREAFVPSGFKHSAYKLDALPMGESQWISSPLTVAKMTQYLECDGADRVLEIGCGSGYQAAVLSHLFRGVFSVERIESLILDAKKRFRHLKISNIHTKVDDGQNGWQQYAPYDRILFSATATKISNKIFEQLSKDGVLVAPMQKGDRQVIMRFKKNGTSIREEELEECIFVPILDGIQKA